MKLFIANIILLVVLQKCEKVLTSSDNLEEATGLTDTNEEDICVMCHEEMNVNDFIHPCCTVKYHKKCLYKFITYNKLICPICKKNPFERIRMCHKCQTDKSDNELEKMKCCGIDLCKFCVKNNLSTQCMCNEDLVKGLIFDPNRLCTFCGIVKGKYSYSSRCPEIYCKRCFKSLSNQCNGHCPYCREERTKKKSFSCFP
ncbi:uncharacterized protein LOC126897409 [Daktulosphaira vitifoliae]|uniref:uncharacterized protein LOC126897409 n=1 Tax=Daktulosphaira vitifoliae TaxID=58002 RepID=UPI0021AA9A6F|nr:uncharacterized protein LOC126897409 [Daktulosphaira vitifoliae]